MFLQNDDVHSFCKHYFPATGKDIPVDPRVSTGGTFVVYTMSMAASITNESQSLHKEHPSRGSGNQF